MNIKIIFEKNNNIDLKIIYEKKTYKLKVNDNVLVSTVKEIIYKFT